MISLIEIFNLEKIIFPPVLKQKHEPFAKLG